MRSAPFKRFPKQIALILKGSGQIVRLATIVGCRGPLWAQQLIASHDRHRMPEAGILNGEFAKWCYAWKLAEIQRLPQPVSYKHPSGAVIWVTLDPSVQAALKTSMAA